MILEERRRELAKQAKSEVEEAKISIRAARKDANSEIKNTEDASEDIQKNAEVDVQQLTDAHVKKAEELYAAKEIEILKI
jgi:ribosome recycling factor